jgi:hypothetical protein
MACRVVVTLFIVIMFSCVEKAKGKREHQDNQVRIQDISVDFNGKMVKGWEVTNFGPQGPVYVSNGEIILGMGDGCTGITWKGEFPSHDYEVTLEAKRVEGNDFFCGMTFPAGIFPCTLIVGGWGGTTVGLSSINGLDASDNSTRMLMQFDKNRWYTIRLRVREKKIEAWIDAIKAVDFTIGDSKLSIRPEVELSKPFGIASWNTTAAIRNIRVISGK